MAPACAPTSAAKSPTGGGPNITAFTTNTAGTTGRSMGVTVRHAASAVTGQVHSWRNAATRYAPFLPLAAGDTHQRPQAFTFSGGTAHTGTGQLVLHLVKPLWRIPIPAWASSERDFVNQLPACQNPRRCVPAVPAVSDRRHHHHLAADRCGRLRLRRLIMDKTILDIVNDFAQWKGNAYPGRAGGRRSARIDKQALVDAGRADAAEALP